MKKLLHIVGARPQFVKLAPLYHALETRFAQTILHTGQHYDSAMSDFFFRDLVIPLPDYNLSIGSGSHGEQTGLMLIEIEKVVQKDTPDLFIVYGDTNSTLAGAIVASKLQIPCIHIEACLRSFNRSMPEEINRIVADHISTWLFCPTETAMGNAAKEGLTEKAILTGDIMVDSVWEGVARAKKQSTALPDQKLTPQSYNLLTLHRPYNVDDSQNLYSILSELDKLNELVIFPVHPRTRAIINNSPHNFDKLQNIRCIAPLGYLDFIQLEQNSMRIITDSGGIQKEAYILQKSCITLRTETEWVETVQEGWNLLLAPHTPDFHQAIQKFQPPTTQNDVFGTNVASKMAEVIGNIV